MTKESRGRFFEDFRLGQEIAHATPRTLTAGDQALYVALTGSRFALHSSDEFARRLGLPQAPLDDLLVFHLVMGKSVPDISVNAVANLGYADGRFGAFVFPGDTLAARSTVIGLRETREGKSGIVYLRTAGSNQRGERVLDYVRWVMVQKRDPASPPPDPTVPELPAAVTADRLVLPDRLDLSGWDAEAAGSPWRWGDFAAGERIDHVDGMTVEEACHMMATRLYQNTARVHFDARLQKESRFGRRLIFGGHVISIARALSFNGLGAATRVLALNGGRHVAPCFAGDTVYAWSEVLERAELPGRRDAGALRLRMVAVKDRPAAGFPDRGADGEYDPSVILDLDYWALAPR
jgi:2-methylfumaryl-CoA hydratase